MSDTYPIKPCRACGEPFEARGNRVYCTPCKERNPLHPERAAGYACIVCDGPFHEQIDAALARGVNSRVIARTLHRLGIEVDRPFPSLVHAVGRHRGFHGTVPKAAA